MRETTRFPRARVGVILVRLLFLVIAPNLLSHTDFITDDVSAPQDRPITPIEPADPEDELEALRAIARDIESRAPRLGFGRPSTMDLGITSKTYDVSLSENNFWRVRVKV